MLNDDIRKDIERVYGKEVLYPKDCEALAGKISQETGCAISASTVKRLLGFIKANGNPSQYTLDTIALYLGSKNWEALRQGTEIHDEETGPVEIANSVQREAVTPLHAASRSKIAMRYVPVLLLIAVLGFSFFKFLYPSTRDLSVLKFRSLADMPEPREGGRLLAMNNNCYYLGGSHALTPQDNCWLYNGASNSWETLRPMPTPRVEMASALIGRKIYTFGGWLGDDSGMTDVAEIYDTQTNAWDTLPGLPLKMTCASAVSAGDDIYILGGTVGGATTTHFLKYNTVSSTYERLPLFNQVMIYSALVVADNKIYALGGQSYSRMELGRRHNKVYAFDLDKKAWTEKSSMPISVTRSSAVLLGNKIHLLGGLDADFSLGSAGIENTHFIYDIRADCWEIGENLPFALCAHQSTFIDGKVVLFGGMLDFPHSTDKVISLMLHENDGIPFSAQAGR